MPELSLEKCIKLLKNREDDPPLSCYKLLDFPKEPRDKRIKPGPHYIFLQRLFGSSKIGITKAIRVESQHKIWVPPNFHRSLQYHHQRYLLIPVQFRNSKDNYAILYDKRKKELEVFIPPGTKPVKNHQKLELKFRDLFVNRLRVPLQLFYHSITYGPPPNTLHADFWPSWLIVKRIKTGLERELLVNKALENILTQTPEYSKFVQEFTDYIIQNS